MQELSVWVWFNVFVLAMLALDLGVFNRRSHVVSSKEASIWTSVWVGLALLFNIGIYYFMGAEKGMEWTTGYLIEESLSADNIFVFVIMMACFRVPPELQHRLLFFGIIGALVMRGTAIGVGTFMVQHWSWIFYLFGAFLLLTGVRMFRTDGDVADPTQIPAVTWLQKHLPVTHEYQGNKFFLRTEAGKLMVTPLVPALIAIEGSDLIFAVDSIPAIFAITDDPFIVYTSNVFAILGLRSLYFLLAQAVTKFHYLKFGLAVVLCFVGTKMLIREFVHIPVIVSLLFIVATIAGAVIYSLRHPVAPQCPVKSVNKRDQKTSVR